MRRPCAALALLLALLAAGCARDVAAPAGPLPTALPVQAPAAAAAGEVLEVTVGPVDLPDGSLVTLRMQGAAGVRLYRAPFFAGQARVTIPGADTQSAGWTAFTALVAGDEGDRQVTGHAGTEIMAGPPVEPVRPFVGPRSVVADGRDWSMVVAMPQDRYGNPLAEGAPVALTVRYPDGHTVTTPAPMRDLVATTVVTSNRTAGRVALGLDAQGRFGPEGEFRQVAGPPQPFALHVDATTPLIADGRQQVLLRSDPLLDANGNPLPDGVRVMVQMEERAGDAAGSLLSTYAIPAAVLDGYVILRVRAPAQPSTLIARGVVLGAVGEPLVMRFAEGVAAAPMRVAATVDEAAGALQLEAGPLLGPIGQYAADGLEVRFTVTPQEAGDVAEPMHRVTGVSNTGYARAAVRLAVLPAGVYRVTAAAGSATATTTVTVP